VYLKEESKICEKMMTTIDHRNACYNLEPFSELSNFGENFG
jgi:hypothetical protein